MAREEWRLTSQVISPSSLERAVARNSSERMLTRPLEDLPPTMWTCTFTPRPLIRCCFYRSKNVYIIVEFRGFDKEGGNPRNPHTYFADRLFSKATQ